MPVYYRLAVCLLILFAAIASAQQLVVETDAASYLVGDLVHVTVTNPTDHVVSCTSQPIFAIGHLASGTCVFGCIGLPVIEDIEPGAMVTYDHDSTGNQPGLYEIVVFEMWDGVTIPPPPSPSTQYTLQSPTSNEDEVWGGVKALYR